MEQGGIVGTTVALAGKLECKSGPDLLMAAAAHLTFVAGKSEFSRKQLRDEAKGASGYYTESIQKNMSAYLTSLVKRGDLVEPKSGYYALSATKQTEMRSSLAT